MQMAAIYARVSSEQQREAHTIASQTAALIELAKTLTLEVPKAWIFEDEGYSGATLERPGLERVRDLAAEASPLETEDGLLITSAVRETTDRRHLEQGLRQAQKMEAIGQLAGGVAHDFNNMLTAILGYSELLTQQIGPDKPMGQDLREITAAAQRAATLTRQLLAFSRKQAFALAALDLSQIVRGVEGMLRRVIGEQITVKTELADDVSPVMADATQLEQVVMNLAQPCERLCMPGCPVSDRRRNIPSAHKSRPCAPTRSNTGWTSSRNLPTKGTAGRGWIGRPWTGCGMWRSAAGLRCY